MIEDDIYRTSTQYRLWSYTPNQLNSLRTTTNSLASKRVLAAIRRKKGDESATISTLTVDEEIKIINWGCAKIIEIGQSIKPSPVPREIQCTAIQYLRRFYLMNSPMTYHPKTILTCALYLATKSSHWHIGIGRYVAELEGVAEDEVKAPEFLLMQGLRFTLEVRHPVKGLEGGHLELLDMWKSKQLPATYSERKIGDIVKQSRELLRGPVQMTDVYFLYTPAQIWLAALQTIDLDLVNLYLEHKLSDLPDSSSSAADADILSILKSKLLATITSCASIISAAAEANDDNTDPKELRRIGKKLHLAQNPEKADLVAATSAETRSSGGGGSKRDGARGGGLGQELDAEREEKRAKKRKMEREMRERDADVFGGELKNVRRDSGEMGKG